MDVMDWLLDGDPAIRWQVRRDLLHEPDDAVAAERANVEAEGWGRELLDLQRKDGTWGDGVWTPEDRLGVDDAMLLLVLLGAPRTGERTRIAVDRVVRRVDWGEEWWNHPFFDGEVEPCINGRVLVAGARFGYPSELIVERLLNEQQTDGGWNCYAETRADPGSFHSTICALEGLVAYRDEGGPTDVASAIEGGHEYLLSRGLMRHRSDRSVIDERWLEFSFPHYWSFDVLRGLDHLRAAGVAADARVTEAVDVVAARRQPDGRWLLDHEHSGRALLDMETVGAPSRWNTLRALRVLEWAGRS